MVPPILKPLADSRSSSMRQPLSNRVRCGESRRTQYIRCQRWLKSLHALRRIAQVVLGCYRTFDKHNSPKVLRCQMGKVLKRHLYRFDMELRRHHCRLGTELKRYHCRLGRVPKRHHCRLGTELKRYHCRLGMVPKRHHCRLGTELRTHHCRLGTVPKRHHCRLGTELRRHHCQSGRALQSH